MSQLQSAPGQEISAAEFDQVMFIKYYMEEGVAWKAYKRLHPDVSDGSAYTLGSRMLRKVQMSDLMEEVGLSKKNIALLLAQTAAKPTKKLLKKTIVRTETPLLPDGEQEKFYTDKKGRIMLLGTQEVTEFQYEDVIDNGARNQALRLAAQLNKSLKDTDDGDGKSVNIGAIQIINYADAQPAEKPPEITEGEIVQTTVGQLATDTTDTSPNEQQPVSQPAGVQITKYQ